jgi:hypothetical protein
MTASVVSATLMMLVLGSRPMRSERMSEGGRPTALPTPSSGARLLPSSTVLAGVMLSSFHMFSDDCGRV